MLQQRTRFNWFLDTGQEKKRITPTIQSVVRLLHGQSEGKNRKCLMWGQRATSSPFPRLSFLLLLFGLGSGFGGRNRIEYLWHPVCLCGYCYYGKWVPFRATPRNRFWNRHHWGGLSLVKDKWRLIIHWLINWFSSPVPPWQRKCELIYFRSFESLPIYHWRPRTSVQGNASCDLYCSRLAMVTEDATGTRRWPAAWPHSLCCPKFVCYNYNWP